MPQLIFLLMIVPSPVYRAPQPSRQFAKYGAIQEKRPISNILSRVKETMWRIVRMNRNVFLKPS
jgi:hypothetical protein